MGQGQLVKCTVIGMGGSLRGARSDRPTAFSIGAKSNSIISYTGTEPAERFFPSKASREKGASYVISHAAVSRKKTKGRGRDQDRKTRRADGWKRK